MALEGNLRTLSFADVAQLLGSTNKTGVLHLRRGAAWKKIYLRDGTVIAVSSSDPDEFVGATLVATGKVREVDLSTALIRQQREGKLLCKILLEEGKIAEPVVKRYLAENAFAMVAKLMNWTDAMFRFEEYALPTHELISLDLSVEALLMEGFRRADELDRFREVLPGEDTVVELMPVGEGKPFDASETMVGLVLDKLGQGPRTVRDLRRELKTPEFVLLDGLTKLIESGRVRRTVAVPTPAVPEREWLQAARKFMLAGLSERAVQTLRTGLVHEPTNGEARALLASADARLVRDLTRAELPLASVVALVSPIEDLLERSLSPTEAFLLSRIDGQADIDAILENAPLPPSEVLLSLRRLLRDGYLLLRA